jgi:hypothetical protein
VNYKEQTGANHSTYQRVEGGVGDKLGIRRYVPAQAPYQRDGREKADDHHQAVAFYSQMDKRQLE